jgi:putative transposase
VTQAAHLSEPIHEPIHEPILPLHHYAWLAAGRSCTDDYSDRLVRIFDRLRKTRGLPQILRTDNGPEFLGEAFTQWARNAGMAIQYIQPGKPNQNAYIERFNRTLRNELLDQHLFVRLEDVREAAYWWMLEYNEERPHDSLGDMTPAEFAQVARNSSLELSP